MWVNLFTTSADDNITKQMRRVIKSINDVTFSVVGVNHDAFQLRIFPVRFQQPSIIGKIGDADIVRIGHIHPEAAQPIYSCGMKMNDASHTPLPSTQCTSALAKTP